MFEVSLSAAYGKRKILDEVQFSLPGGVTALLGRNGCGKSTLLNCIAGALPCKGSVKLEGEELTALPARERAKRIGILPQILPSPDLPAEEVVSFGRSPFSTRLSKTEKENVLSVMRKLGIEELKERRVSTLSGGGRLLSLYPYRQRNKTMPSVSYRFAPNARSTISCSRHSSRVPAKEIAPFSRSSTFSAA